MIKFTFEVIAEKLIVEVSADTEEEAEEMAIDEFNRLYSIDQVNMIASS